MSYPRYAIARSHRYKTLASVTTSTFTTTTPVQIDPVLDLILEAQVGDVIECGISAFWTPTTNSQYGTLDVVGVTGGIYLSSETTTPAAGGIPSWQSNHTSTGSMSAHNAGGSAMRTIVAGDLVDGQVTLRPVGFLSAAGSRSLVVSAATRFHFWAKNIGPSDPE